MYFRPAICFILAILLLVSGTGCQKTISESSAPAATILSPDTVIHVHWLGKKQLGIMAGAYYISRMWQLPTSAQLERQTLFKLASAPDRWLSNGTNLPPDITPRLWLLLNDLVQEQSYLEIRRPTNQALELAFAIRLTPDQTKQWTTNLAAVVEALTGSHAVVDSGKVSWSLKTTNSLIQLTTVGGWTLLGVSPLKNMLLQEVASRIEREHVPFVSAETNLWIEAGFDLSRLEPNPLSRFVEEGAGKFSLRSLFSSSCFDRFNLAVSGDGANVITQAKLKFSKPMPAEFQPWALPMPLLHQPLSSFTAVRGLQSWFASMSWWPKLPMGEPPDQLFVWSVAGNPYQTYWAAPMESRKVSIFTDWLMENCNPYLAAHDYVRIGRASNGNGIEWGNLPSIKPFIKSAVAGSNSWIFGGMMTDTNFAPLPSNSGLTQYILQGTNLAYYDWEVTGPRLQPCMELCQTLRQISRRPDLSVESSSSVWIGSLIPRLGTSATIVKRTSPTELTFYRRATLGLTASELQILADWLESPDFPKFPFSFSTLETLAK